MALMILLRLPTQDDLDEFQIDLESFYQDFITNSAGPFTATVQVKNGDVDLAGYKIAKRDWFNVVEN